MAQPVIVSVIIVSWNARAYLEKCLATLNASTCRYPMEILVVDNASADGSPEMVEQKFPHVRVIRTGANLGFAKANNVGIKASSGKYLALVNSDVEVLDHCLTKLVDFCDAHPEVGLAGPRVIGGDGFLQRSCRGFPSLWNMFCRALALDSILPGFPPFSGYLLRHWKHEDQRESEILSGCFWLARAEAVKVVGGLDENFFMYGEDMDWCKRFWKAGWKLMFVPSAEAIHYGGASSSNAPLRFYIEKQRADLQYWRKHHSWLAVQVYFLISCLYHFLRMLGGAALCVVKRGSANARYQFDRSLGCLKWMLTPGAPVPRG